MKVRISSLNSITIVPESDAEKLIFDSWYSRVVVVNPTINNAGLNYPTRFISYTITFEEKPNVNRL